MFSESAGDCLPEGGPAHLPVTDLEFRDVEPPEQRLRSDACCSGGFFDIHLQTQTLAASA